MFHLLLLAAALLQLLPPIAGGETSPAEPALPLGASGRYIIDANSRRVKLAAVNWYGAEEQDYVVAGLEYAALPDIARQIRIMGFNAVRLPWSNEMYEANPAINDDRLAANPSLKGKRALEVFDAVIAALASEGLFVILDNHISDAGWCCSNTDGNGLWYNGRFPESTWIADWQGMAQRYLDQPAVIGADLRNEPRAGATWGGSDARYDWRAAAERGGNAALAVNPNWLIFVEGINYAADLTSALGSPVRLNVGRRLVYSSHDYSWFHSNPPSYDALKAQLDGSWGYLVQADAPVWLGEFGTCHTSASCVASSSPGTGGFWFSNLQRHMQERDLDWAYWAWNGTQARGAGRTLGAEETYGIVDQTWSRSASPLLLNALQAITAPTAAPAINSGGIVNAATFAATPVVPGSLASVFGSDLAPVTSGADTVPLPAALGGGAIRINQSLAAPLLYASPSQVNIQIPWELDAASPASLTANVGWLSSPAEPLVTAGAAPGIFLAQPGVSAQGAILIANTHLLAMQPSATLPNARPARAGEYISIFCTGLGAVTNRPATGIPASFGPLSRTIQEPEVGIGGARVQPRFSGLAPGFVGLYQVDVQIPAGAVPGDAVPVSISISGADSNVVTIAIQ